jgi:hypothetical protein
MNFRYFYKMHHIVSISYVRDDLNTINIFYISNYDNRLPLNHGELDVLSLVFQESQEAARVAPDRVLSVTCAEVVECSVLPRSGESGTRRSV